MLGVHDLRSDQDLVTLVEERLATGAIDRLLQSPHYGERMATDWLDGARFADSNGYQNDFARNMSPWRDWVIDAFNKHMRYDQFVVEQIAGDLLPNSTLSQRIATGFNRNHRTVTEAGSIEDEWFVENVVDRVETTGTVMLGLTPAITSFTFAVISVCGRLVRIRNCPPATGRCSCPVGMKAIGPNGSRTS